MTPLSLSTLISEADLQKRVIQIGKEITDDLNGEDIVALCVLKGSFMFYADLIRNIDVEMSCDFLAVSSYNGGIQSSGEVKLTLDLSRPIHDKNVLLIEDIVDTGLTMNYLQQALSARQPKTLKTVTLLHKPEAKKVDCHLDHIGFEIGNEFVVGYGLDYQGFYRNIPYIARVNNIN